MGDFGKFTTLTVWSSNVAVGRAELAMGRPDERFLWAVALRRADITANGYGVTPEDAERQALDALCADTGEESVSAATLAAAVGKLRSEHG